MIGGADLRRQATKVGRAGYRRLLAVLPAEAASRLQTRVARTRLDQHIRRRPRPLHLEGTGPVTLVDCRGLDEDRLAAAAAEIAAGPDPIRRVLLVDRPDFLGLRALGLSFEYVPPADSSSRWFVDQAAHAAFTEQRLREIRTSLGVTGGIDSSFVAKPV